MEKQSRDLQATCWPLQEVNSVVVDAAPGEAPRAVGQAGLVFQDFAWIKYGGFAHKAVAWPGEIA